MQQSNDQKNALIEIIDKKPRKMSTKLPLLLAPGWGNTLSNMKATIEELARSRRVISLGHLRRPHNIPRKHPDKKHDLEEIHKALSILAVIKTKRIKKIDAVAYSEGGINLLLAAKLDPKRFRNIVLVNPAGMTGCENATNLIKRFLSEMHQSSKDFLNNPEIRQPVALFFKELAKYIKDNPKKAWLEVKAISCADIRTLISELRKKDINFAIIHSTNDRVFPINKIKNNINYEHIEFFYSVEGGHGEIFLRPKKIIPLINKALDDLDKK